MNFFRIALLVSLSLVSQFLWNHTSLACDAFWNTANLACCGSKTKALTSAQWLDRGVDTKGEKGGNKKVLNYLQTNKRMTLKEVRANPHYFIHAPIEGVTLVYNIAKIFPFKIELERKNFATDEEFVKKVALRAEMYKVFGADGIEGFHLRGLEKARNQATLQISESDIALIRSSPTNYIDDTGIALHFGALVGVLVDRLPTAKSMEMETKRPPVQAYSTTGPASESMEQGTDSESEEDDFVDDTKALLGQRYGSFGTSKPTSGLCVDF